MFDFLFFNDFLLSFSLLLHFSLSSPGPCDVGISLDDVPWKEGCSSSTGYDGHLKQTFDFSVTVPARYGTGMRWADLPVPGTGSTYPSGKQETRNERTNFERNNA
jgi:hypothetical protein